MRKIKENIYPVATRVSKEIDEKLAKVCNAKGITVAEYLRDLITRSVKNAKG